MGGGGWWQGTVVLVTAGCSPLFCRGHHYCGWHCCHASVCCVPPCVSPLCLSVCFCSAPWWALIKQRLRYGRGAGWSKTDFGQTQQKQISLRVWPHVVRLTRPQNKNVPQFHFGGWTEKESVYECSPSSGATARGLWRVDVVWSCGSPSWQKWHAWSKAGHLPLGCFSLCAQLCPPACLTLALHHEGLCSK